ncbi:MAG TPA: stage III sporulation protein AA [Clostridiales bacterium]|nr:stage III sporulation protein AA [Clostridiales bacterium]
MGNITSYRYGDVCKAKFSQRVKKDVFDVMPLNIRSILYNMDTDLIFSLEEIRLRVYKPLMIVCQSGNHFIDANGRVTDNHEKAYIVTKEDMERTLQFMAEYSIYALEEELRLGYLTLKGGYRVGLSGKVVLNNNEVKTIKYISSFNIRISREVIGSAQPIIPHILGSNNRILHTLIISPPKMGKTTILRDLARLLSNGNKYMKGVKVGIVDERSEIAGCYQGVPQNDVGVRTDVLDGCPKALGMMMMIRSLSPEVIITDEIGRQEDIYALEEALNSGISVITSVHGNDFEDVKRRPVVWQILKKNIFKVIIVLGKNQVPGTIDSIYKLSNNSDTYEEIIGV